MERSLILIKPDAMLRGHGGAIVGRFQQNGLRLVALRMLKMDRTLAGKHYAVHAGKPFFNGLIDYITSAPIIAAVFEGNDVIARARKIMGATDPAKAEADTIRKDFGVNIQENAVHGSDSPENAAKEIALYFRGDELFDY